MRLSQLARKLNVGIDSIVVHLKGKGVDIDHSPSTKLSNQQIDLLNQAFAGSLAIKREADKFAAEKKQKKKIKAEEIGSLIKEEKKKQVEGPIVTARATEPTQVDLTLSTESVSQAQKPQEPLPVVADAPIKKKVEKIDLSHEGIKVLGNIDISSFMKPRKKSFTQVASSDNKKKYPFASSQNDKPKKAYKKEKLDLPPEDIEKQLKEMLQEISQGKAKQNKYRKEKKEKIAEAQKQRLKEGMERATTIEVAPHTSVSDLANLLDVDANEILAICMDLGIIATINQRLNEEAIEMISSSLDKKVVFTALEVDQEEEMAEDPAKLKPRAPIVTVMGHVDHGKTSLLDYIRKSNVTEGEAGGITQRVVAYKVERSKKHTIVFLDTPGHEAFTAMRARGAQITDIVIVVIAADDGVMPQTKEAISHAQLAGVPIIIAFNKIDKPSARVDRIKEQLSQQSVLVEDWGGKVQSHEISAKTGKGIDGLLEKVSLEAELMELKANPDKPGIGIVLEASLIHGKGYVTTLIIQEGTLKVGDPILAGPAFGKVKALFETSGKRIQQAGPSMPVQVLGLSQAPPAGQKLRVVEHEKEAKNLAGQYHQNMREQQIRMQKHATLDKVVEKSNIEGLQRLNLIIKGDVDGSVQAFADSALKLKDDKTEINIIYKAVGPINESDVMLADASDALIVGFQVKPTPQIQRVAKAQKVRITTHNIIYKALEELEELVNQLHRPKTKEELKGRAEVKKVFDISRVGRIAGCEVTHGLIKRNHAIRVIRNGQEVHKGEINQLKKEKEKIKEAKKGSECGIDIVDFNEIKEGDVIESFTVVELK